MNYKDILKKYNLESLRYANFREANLQNANFVGVYFEEINFERANLQGANFHGVYFEEVNFEGANLQGANLVGVYFEKANLQGANLQDIIFNEHTYFKDITIDSLNYIRLKLLNATIENPTIIYKQNKED